MAGELKILDFFGGDDRLTVNGAPSQEENEEKETLHGLVFQ